MKLATNSRLRDDLRIQFKERFAEFNRVRTECLGVPVSLQRDLMVPA